MYDEFVRNRINELRLRKNVSEYQMSAALGRSSGYLYNISSGKALPSLRELFAIVDYFEITLTEFFNEHNLYPDLISQAVQGMSRLNKEDIEALLMIIGQFCVMRETLNDFSKIESDSKETAKLK